MKHKFKNSYRIVKKSKSNLAFTLYLIPKEKRSDMIIFYAFCRIIDDIADDHQTNEDYKFKSLNKWRDLINKRESPNQGIESEVICLLNKYSLNPIILEEIIDGVQSDINDLYFNTFQDLLKYCYKVASAVGLITIQILGFKNNETKKYAENLGYALQIVNIIRDIGEDAKNNKVFIPNEHLEKFNLKKEDILSLSPPKKNFLELMHYECEIAENLYQKALDYLPNEDIKNMQSPQLMGKLYFNILKKIKNDNYKVFEKRYKLSKLYMVKEFIKSLLLNII